MVAAIRKIASGAGDAVGCCFILMWAVVSYWYFDSSLWPCVGMLKSWLTGGGGLGQARRAGGRRADIDAVS
jgi:hypothetical protein